MNIIPTSERRHGIRHGIFERCLGYGVHLYTASGIVPAFLATTEIFSKSCDPRWVFAYLLLSTLIDATDGPLARKFHVKLTAPQIDGRTIDDLLDYLTFVFIPLLLVWRMEWLPAGMGWTVSLAMLASLLGFAHRDAKDETHGFFRGFPSYWNIFAFYAGLISASTNAWWTASLFGVLTIATIAPVRLIYPNLAPPRQRVWILGGAAIWTILMVAMLPNYPNNSGWLIIVSAIYPAAYLLLSIHNDIQFRRVGRSLNH